MRTGINTAAAVHTTDTGAEYGTAVLLSFSVVCVLLKNIGTYEFCRVGLFRERSPVVDRSPPLGRDCVIAGTAISEDAYKQVSPFLDVHEGVISIVAFDSDHCVQVRDKNDENVVK